MSASNEAVAMMMRELICEQVYRERANWNTEHPNKALGVRTITPEEVISVTKDQYLKYNKDEWKSLASAVLDKLIARRRLYWVSSRCRTSEKYTPTNPDEDVYEVGDAEACLCGHLKCASILVDEFKVSWCACPAPTTGPGTKCENCMLPVRPVVVDGYAISR